MQISVCKDCGDRKIGCHSTCEAYIKEKAKIEEERQKLKMNSDILNDRYRYSRKMEVMNKQLKKYGKSYL